MHQPSHLTRLLSKATWTAISLRSQRGPSASRDGDLPTEAVTKRRWMTQRTFDHPGRCATAEYDSVGDAKSRKGRLSRRALKAALAAPELVAKRRPGPRILIYHQVGTNLGREMEVATETFANQIRYLEAEGSIVSLDDAIARVGTPDDDRLFVVTFDEDRKSVG